LTICLAKHDMIFPFLHTILFDFSGRWVQHCSQQTIDILYSKYMYY
jgi:hypothetical protein